MFVKLVKSNNSEFRLSKKQNKQIRSGVSINKLSDCINSVKCLKLNQLEQSEIKFNSIILI